MDFQPAIPREAAALILLNDLGEKILWARRNPRLKVLGGFHSFPGGKAERTDSECPVRNCDDPETARLIVCAARETFEEIGVLLVRNGDRLTKGQLPLLHDDLDSGRNTFGEILDHWGLWIDADDFFYAGVWTSPEFSRIRFQTTFFVARCPSKQIPYSAITELQEVEFIDTKTALGLWSRSEVLIAPPVLKAIEAFDEVLEEGTSNSRLAAKFAGHATDHEDGGHFIELNSRLVCLPVRTRTLPPATHTNCYIVGGKRFVVIDAATPFEGEQERLIAVVSDLLEAGNVCAAIIVSHLHPDHFGGETILRKRIFERFGVDIPIVGHKITIESLEGKVVFDSETQDSYVLQDSDGKDFRLDVVHTPGHARGHLCFYDEEFGFLLSSDNVVGEGTVVIAPPEGNMAEYLRSLAIMRSLPGLHSLAGSHGAAVSDAKSKIDSYIEHRLGREKQIRNLISNGAQGIEDIVARVYPNLDPRLLPLAEKSVEAHIEKLLAEGSLPDVWADGV